jgi:hypothetical protein
MKLINKLRGQKFNLGRKKKKTMFSNTVVTFIDARYHWSLLNDSVDSRESVRGSERLQDLREIDSFRG